MGAHSSSVSPSLFRHFLLNLDLFSLISLQNPNSLPFFVLISSLKFKTLNPKIDQHSSKEATRISLPNASPSRSHLKPLSLMASSSSSSSGFFAICFLHSAVAISCGALMMFYSSEISAFGHGRETASKLQGSTPHDQLLIQISDSFAGLLLFAVGFLLFMVAFVTDRDFQSFFAMGCILLHVSMALWRVYFERRLEDLARDWPRQVAGDVMLSISWVLFLVYSWREKYD